MLKIKIKKEEILTQTQHKLMEEIEKRRDLESKLRARNLDLSSLAEKLTRSNGRLKVTKAQLIQSEGELKHLIDAANAPIFSVNHDLQINAWNQAAELSTGYAKDEVIDSLFIYELAIDKEKDLVRNIFNNTLAGKETSNFEFHLKAKNGTIKTILLNTTTRRGFDASILGVMGIGQDISHLKEVESELQQARKMEALGQLTGGIAHDFNNFLSIIQGNLRFLQEDLGDVGNDIKLLFEDALSAVKDGSELTGLLLQFSSNRNVQPKIQGVNKTIEKLYRLMSRTIGEKFSLDMNLAGEELFVNVDASQLENSLINLVINARDAMPNGGEIGITAEKIGYEEAKQKIKQIEMNESSTQGFVKVSVSDQGEGIEPGIISRITEPFFTTKNLGAGTGLGLSMVYSFLKTSGGFLQIESEVGKGANVEMYFPLMREQKNSSTEIEIEIAVSSKPIALTTILVVEDEARVRKITTRDLRQLNYKTIEAENADMAVSIIESGEEIDIMFSDILMPGDMDGRMLGDWVKEHYPEIKIVLTSGYSKGKGGVKNLLGNENHANYPIVRKPYLINVLAKYIQDAHDDN